MSAVRGNFGPKLNLRRHLIKLDRGCNLSVSGVPSLWTEILIYPEFSLGAVYYRKDFTAREEQEKQMT